MKVYEHIFQKALEASEKGERVKAFILAVSAGLMEAEEKLSEEPHPLFKMLPEECRERA